MCHKSNQGLYLVEDIESRQIKWAVEELSCCGCSFRVKILASPAKIHLVVGNVLNAHFMLGLGQMNEEDPEKSRFVILYCCKKLGVRAVFCSSLSF